MRKSNYPTQANGGLEWGTQKLFDRAKWPARRRRSELHKLKVRQKGTAPAKGAVDTRLATSIITIQGAESGRFARNYISNALKMLREIVRCELLTGDKACMGHSGGVEKKSNFPTQANGGLEWGTQRCRPAKS